MADTASLVARVKTEGAEAAARQLDVLSASADGAESSSNVLAQTTVKTGNEFKRILSPLVSYNAVISRLSGEVISLSASQKRLEAENSQLTSELKNATSAASSNAQQIDALQNKIEQLNQKLAKSPAATKAANDSFGSLRNTAGQVGFQVQDMVVQLQSGTSAFVAIGQQGSQLAGAFGPGGAVLGAVIALASAVGGVLYKAFTDTGASAKDLEKGASELSKSFQTARDGSIEFSDALIQLSQNGDAAYGSMVKLIGLQANQQIERATTAIREQGKELLGGSVSAQTNITTLDELIARNADVAKTLESINVVADANSAKYGNLAVAVKEMADNYGVSTQQITDMLVAQRQFNAEPTAENAQKVADATTRAAASATENKKELLDQAEAAQKNAVALQTAEKQLELTTAAQNRNGAATNSTTQRIREQNDALVKSAQIATLSERDRVRAMAEADKEAFAKREGVTKDQIDAYNKAKDEETRQDIARIDKTEKEKNDRIAKTAKDREEAAAKRAENEAQRQQKAADDFLNTLARQNTDELKAIDAQEQQKLAKLQEFQEQGNLTQQQFEDARTQIVLDADTKRNELLQKQRDEQAKKQNSADSFIAQLQAQNEGELAEIDRQQEIKQKKLDDFYKQGLVSEKDYQKARQNIQDEADQKRLDSYEGTLSDTTSALKSALGEGNALYKAAAITQTIIETYKGATAAYASLSTIPVVGPALGVAAAAAVTAAGLANVAKIRSAREQGGYLAAGQASTIAERGKPEVIMPAGASRVRTAEQMRQIMGESGSSSGIPQISIINQTTGRIDEVRQEQDDEGRIRLLIRETVATDLLDSNSRITKSRKATRGQAGFN